MIISKNPAQLSSNHANQRAEDRYNVVTDSILVNGLLSKIRQGKGHLLHMSNDSSRVVYKVRYRKKSFVLVVNRTIDSIITFLPQATNKFLNM